MEGSTAQARDGSLHQRIRGDLEERILSGTWPPGHRIPPEHELTVHYGCSRMTVNKAVADLVRAGLVERRRRAGSFVRRPVSQSAVLEIRDIALEVAAGGMPYRYERLARVERRSGTVDRGLLGLDAPSRVLALVCRHFAGTRPFCFEERLIDLATVPDARAESFEAIAPGSWLVARVPWTAAEHTIRAVEADATLADRLALTPGRACLAIERRTWSAGRPVTFVRLTYPGDQHELVARFTPAQD